MDPILAVIVACEIGFWVVVALGLLARYGLGRRRTGAMLLVLTPVVDLVLLGAVVLHLRDGGTATFLHGLAAVYIGVSIAYGHKMVRWADSRVAHRFAGAPAPARLLGRAYAAECWRDLVRTSLAAGIAAGILGSLISVVDAPSRTDAMLGILPVLGIWWVIDLIWAASYTVSPRRPPARA